MDATTPSPASAAPTSAASVAAPPTSTTSTASTTPSAPPIDALGRLDARRAARLRFLHALYEAADGSPDTTVDFEPFAAQLGLALEPAWTIRGYLSREGLVRGVTTSALRITHDGVKQVEAALTAPSAPTEGFPPAENVLVIGTAEGTVVQQGNVDSVQQVELGGAALEDARRLAAELETQLASLEGGSAELRELVAEAATASAQLRGARPRLAAVKETVGTVRDLLESAAASGKAVAGILSALGAASALLRVLG
jgi:hypothetical protein